MEQYYQYEINNDERAIPMNFIYKALDIIYSKATQIISLSFHTYLLVTKVIFKKDDQWLGLNRMSNGAGNAFKVRHMIEPITCHKT